MTLADNRRTIRGVSDHQLTTTSSVLKAVSRLFDQAAFDGFDPDRIDLATMRISRVNDEGTIEATARYGRLSDECGICHQTPGRPHTEFCPRTGIVVADG
jgi:hypothetical protein